MLPCQHVDVNADGFLCDQRSHATAATRTAMARCTFSAVFKQQHPLQGSDALCSKPSHSSLDLTLMMHNCLAI